MLKYIKKIDSFGKNIILVFLATSLVNLFNLFYQLFIAHRMTGADFAGFNSLLAIFSIASMPLTTLQTVVAKYSAEFNAKNQIKKIQALFSSLMIKLLPLAAITFVIFYLLSFYMMDKLKISSGSVGCILALLLASSWITPIFSGALQGLELFKWFMAISVVVGILKLVFVFIFIELGFNITGALSAFLVSSLIGIVISYPPLKSLFSFKFKEEGVKLKDFLLYFAPVGISLFCFGTLVNMDMIVVK